MNKIEEEIKQASNWIVEAFQTEELVLDYTIESLKLVDQFMDDNTENGQATSNGILSSNSDSILFGIGSYIGETIRRNIPGAAWKINAEEADSGINAAIVLPNGVEIWPIQRIIKRFSTGAEDGIYVYAVVATNDLIRNDYWEKVGKDSLNDNGKKKSKQWWQFW